jgi:hypothetical protein
MHTKTKVGLTKTHFSMLLMNVAIVEVSKATWVSKPITREVFFST